MKHLALMLALLIVGCKEQPVAVPTPAPAPRPSPAPEPSPKKPRKPCWPQPESLSVGQVRGDDFLRVDATKASAAGAKEGGTIAPDGKTEIQIDLPDDAYLRNKGGSDGAGLCVFTSIDMAARWQNVPQLIGFRDWMTRYPGGGHPAKVKQKITQICRERNMPEPHYIQVEGKDLEILKAAFKHGRGVSVTYSRSPTGRYGGSSVAHMVFCSHFTDQWVATADNNYPGKNKLEWCTPDEWVRYCNPRGYWAVILLSPGPPPPPRNRI